MKVVFDVQDADEGVFVLTPAIAIDTKPVSYFSGAFICVGLVWMKWAWFLTFHR